MKLLLTSLLLLTVSGCSQVNKYFGLKDDNDVEQRIEEVIEEETGAKVDFTPESPNKESAQEMPKKQVDQKNVPKKDKKIDV